ncbi:MAG: hypothetical protein DRG31_06210 [Deltaproteobacteria bacterium]|nr:MAG: hypothetical protein DRG31_06210 [Deltaproteobacteria bacterium]
MGVGVFLRFRVFLFPVALFCLFFFVRLKQAEIVFEKPRLYLWGEGVPVLSTLDGYYWLRLAEMIREGAYRPGAPDPLRNAPDNQFGEDEKKVRLPSPPPLLSVLLALTAWISGEPVDRAFLSFPLIPFLAGLLAFPLFFIGKRLWGELAGLGMALGGLFCLEYMVRTDVLRLDTDALNPFFLFLIAYLLLGLLKDFGYRKLIALTVTVHLFQWWYSHPGLILPLLGFYGLGLLISGRGLKETARRTALVVLFCNPWILYEGFCNLWAMVAKYMFPGLMKEELSLIPPEVFSRSVSELKALGMWKVFGLTLTHPLLGYLSLGGLVLFFMRDRRCVILLPLLCLGMMSFWGPRRFMIYLGPFMGLGIGALLQLAEDILEGKLKGKLLLSMRMFLICLLFGSVVAPSKFDVKPVPQIGAPLAEAMGRMRVELSEEAFIWSWWDYGYPVSQIARKAVYLDGGCWRNSKALLVARSFVAKDFQTAYNLINGTTELGKKGIKELLEEGKTPGEVIGEIQQGKYNGELRCPVYWLLTGLDIPKFYWISFFGTWDPKKSEGRHLPYFTLGLCEGRGGGVLCQRGIVDLKRGVLLIPPSKRVKLGELQMIELDEGDRGRIIKVLRMGGGPSVFLVKKGEFMWGYLAKPEVKDTVFHRLFFLGEETSFFEPVFSDFPHVRIFKVKEEM